MKYDLEPIRRAKNKDRHIWGYLLSFGKRNQSEMWKLLGLAERKQAVRVQKNLTKTGLITIETGEDSRGYEQTSIWKGNWEQVIRKVKSELKLPKEEVTFLQSFFNNSIPLLNASLERICNEDKRELEKQQLAPLKHLIDATRKNIDLLPFLPVLLTFDHKIISYGIDEKNYEKMRIWRDLRKKNTIQARMFQGLFTEWFNPQFNDRPREANWVKYTRNATLALMAYEEAKEELSVKPASDFIIKFLGLEEDRYGFIALTKEFGKPEKRIPSRENLASMSVGEIEDILIGWVFHLMKDFPVEIREEINAKWAEEAIPALVNIITNYIDTKRFEPSKRQKEGFKFLRRLREEKKKKSLSFTTLK